MRRHTAPSFDEPLEMLRDFDTSGRLHHEDEDADLLPLLRERAAERQRDEIAGIIDELEREHATMHSQWQRLSADLAAVAAGGGAQRRRREPLRVALPPAHGARIGGRAPARPAER